MIGPSWAINRVLDEISKDGISDGAEETDISFRFVSRTLEVEGDRATVYARGEASGVLRGVETECICIEAIELRRAGGEWSVHGFPLPRLAAVTDALDARHRAFEKRDLKLYEDLTHPDYGDDAAARARLEARLTALLGGRADEPIRQEIVSRTMRIERHEAVVTERWRLVLGEEDDEEVFEGRARYVLAPTDDGWRFISGLM